MTCAQREAAIRSFAVLLDSWLFETHGGQQGPSNQIKPILPKTGTASDQRAGVRALRSGDPRYGSYPTWASGTVARPQQCLVLLVLTSCSLVLEGSEQPP
jgi:hypothetical protein